MKKNVLFVCWGNICRSPSAEAVFNGLIKKRGLEDYISCDSAGTISYHNGERADARMRQHAKKRGYQLDSISRRVESSDFDRFDYVVAMDDNNVQDLYSFMKKPEDQERLSKMTDYCTQHNNSAVPDPYYGGADGFELVLDLLEDACNGLIDQIEDDLEK